MPTADEIRSLHHTADELWELRNTAVRKNDDAAHLLSRYVSNCAADQRYPGQGDWPKLHELVETYNRTWTAYQVAAERWRVAQTQVERAREELAAAVSGRPQLAQDATEPPAGHSGTPTAGHRRGRGTQTVR